MPAGRPSLYSEAVVSELCARIARAECGLEQVCVADDMPHAATVHRWLNEYPEFRERYERAKDEQALLVAERALADALAEDDPQKAQLARLRFDARKWTAGKLAPKKWGDKIEQRHTGHDGGPVTMTVLSGVPRAND